MAVHAIPFLLERGYGAGFAAFAVGLIGISQIPGRMLFAPLAARLPAEWATGLVFALIAAGIGVVVGIHSHGRGRLGLVLLGMGNGMATLARATVVADLYGPADYGTIAGVAALDDDRRARRRTVRGRRLRRRVRLRHAAVDARRRQRGRRRARVSRRARGADPPAREAGMTASMIVVGAGQSGLAAAHAALRAGLRPVVLEASDRAAGAWPRYYDSLTLFSPARYSALPGRPFPGDPERYPTRDEVARYLSDYAAALDADIRLGHRVEHVECAAAASSRARPAARS